MVDDALMCLSVAVSLGGAAGVWVDGGACATAEATAKVSASVEPPVATIPSV